MAKIFLFEQFFKFGLGKQFLQVYRNNDDQGDIKYDCIIDMTDEMQLVKLDDGTWWDLNSGYTNLSEIIGQIIDKNIAEA